MTTDNRKLAEVFRLEFEATRNVEQAVAAVATAVKAQLELPLPPTGPVELRVVVVHQYSRQSKGPENRLAKVRRLAAAEFGVEVRRMSVRSRGDRGSQWHTAARWTAIGVYREMGLSLPCCARAAGMRDHTSVIHALKCIEARPDLQAAIARVRAAMGPDAQSAAGPTATTTATRVEAA
jgi:chromosomal replication initiation ATPase DnaA